MFHQIEHFILKRLIGKAFSDSNYKKSKILYCITLRSIQKKPNGKLNQTI